MAQELAGKVAIVTGASSGIGRATLLRFVEEGAAVLAVGRDERVLAEIAVQVGQNGGQCEAFVADVTDPPAAQQIVTAAVQHLGGIDVLVNAAGIIGMGTIENTTDEAWERMMATNVTAPFRLMRAAVPHLAERQGAVVNVSSVNGLRSFPGVLAYCVSKAGIDHLTRCAALELAPKQVRVNSVNPGVTVTNLHRRSGMAEPQYAAFLERSKETHPLGRPGRPEEIAEMILFLASSRSSWMTGETIALDGGRHLTCAR
jgi:NAD(P)-dependent dehydrogenase (short-subunit alcohol dehydrogenase family)